MAVKAAAFSFTHYLHRKENEIAVAGEENMVSRNLAGPELQLS